MKLRLPAKWATFQAEKPRILLLTSQYFLMGEVVAACERLEIPYVFLNMEAKEMDLQAFVDTLLGALDSFRPDFVFTVNHLGVDNEGVLLHLLHELDLPLASWFVDNPFLILPAYPRHHADKTLIFTWDTDNIAPLKTLGFTNTAYLPLAADVHRFAPGKDLGGANQTDANPAWNAEVSFVGNSMVTKVRKRLEAARPGTALSARYREIAAAFGPSESTSAAGFLLQRYPELADEFRALGSPSRMLAFETLVTWQSTLDYRLACIRRILPFRPLIVGDAGWKELLGGESGWRSLPEVNYYEELPAFYPRSKVNFNCTSLQMKGAVNQRVFDVPAAGAFLITDHRRQMEKLFDPGEEMVSYKEMDEIPELVGRYLRDGAARRRIAEAGRRRVLAEHTYDHRLQTLTATMRRTFGP